MPQIGADPAADIRPALGEVAEQPRRSSGLNGIVTAHRHSPTRNDAQSAIGRRTARKCREILRIAKPIPLPFSVKNR